MQSFECTKNKLRELWKTLYKNTSTGIYEGCYIIEEFEKDFMFEKLMAKMRDSRNEIHRIKYSSQNTQLFIDKEKGWYSKVVMYELYIDLFATDFNGLIGRLDYLQDLGVTLLHLLPIMESPMRGKNIFTTLIEMTRKDGGFDVSGYTKIRSDLLRCSDSKSDDNGMDLFRRFLRECHSRGLKVIMDMVLNHTSDEHEWFIQSKQGIGDKRDYYLWTNNPETFKEAQILNPELCKSNWEPVQEDGKEKWYYFHRFLPNQPDLNYRNPKVLVAMMEVFLHWIMNG